METSLPLGAKVVTLRPENGISWPPGTRDHVQWGRSGKILGTRWDLDGDNYYTVIHDIDGTVARYSPQEIMSADPRVSALRILDLLRFMSDVLCMEDDVTTFIHVSAHGKALIKKCIEDIRHEVDWALDDNANPPEEINDVPKYKCNECQDQKWIDTVSGEQRCYACNR